MSSLFNNLPLSKHQGFPEGPAPDTIKNKETSKVEKSSNHRRANVSKNSINNARGTMSPPEEPDLKNIHKILRLSVVDPETNLPKVKEAQTHNHQNRRTTRNAEESKAKLSDHSIKTYQVSEEFRNKLASISDNHIGKNPHPPQVNKGACESRVFKDMSGKMVGIFKDLTPVGVGIKRTMEVAIKRLLRIRRPTELLPGGVAESKGFAEVVASGLARVIGLESLVPETHFIYGDKGTAGSLQLFGKDYKEAAEVAKANPKIWDNPSTKILNKFQKLIIYDYLIGNLDRHDENWMVKKNDKGEIEDIIAIDNGNSFPESNPHKNDSIILKNQYKWGQNPMANKELTEESRQFIAGLNPEKIQKFMQEQKTKFKGSTNASVKSHATIFFSDAMRDQLMLRLTVLKKMAKEPPSDPSATPTVVKGSPQALSQIRTDKEISDYLFSKEMNIPTK